MRLRRIGTAAAALALAAPTAAHATDWTVNPAGGPCTAANPNCSSIQAAVNAAANSELIKILPKVDGWTENVSISKTGQTVQGDGGEVRVNGTFGFASDPDAKSVTLQRLTLLRSNGSAVDITVGDIDGSRTLNLQSCILSGGGAAAIKATTELVSVNSITITARHVTVADFDTAAAYEQADNGAGTISTTFHSSIVNGTAVGATFDPTNTNSIAVDKNAHFANPGVAENFHLRVGSPAIGAGGTGAGGETATDVDGESRDSAWDRGGDEFVNHAPTQPGLLASRTAALTGESFGFQATGATEPDTPLQDAITTYRWDFGDGATAETSGNIAAHAYATPGQYAIRARAVDKLGAEGQWSGAVTVSVSAPPPPDTTPAPTGTVPGFLEGLGPRRVGADGSPPFLAIASPRANQRISLRKGTPMLRGRTADDTGVRRVELALMRREGARCRWYDGSRAFRLGHCAVARWFRAVIDDFAWRYSFPRRFRPRPGSYFLLVRGADVLGNASSAFSVAARTAIPFRYVR